ncbi:Predicted DNA-binding transcriptional regulator YafY, contains an HTH and WYL domains [Paenibacillus sp. RU4T]|nr:Predicted DNA-binding transcriptional regulator YafY, contains an HTH and WYL domains [Paenibacillus sp. RU4X]SIR43946.1 Predicted DNA-binding transcriptional regulator YafY, contains an HTH and WYL domains [Paenibacillus sp. RU4T]
MRTLAKADNMLSILWLLRSGRKMTAGQLAESLEVHVRTIYRCIDSLCASGVPILADSGPNGGYRILESFSESPLFFDPDEQRALVQASVFAREAGYPYSGDLARALDKLMRYATDEQRSRLNRHADGLEVVHSPTGPLEQEALRELEKAAASGETVIMEYDKGYGKSGASIASSRREFDPYGIVHWKGAWYTVGFCRLRGELRSFRADRIRSIETSSLRFEKPEGFSAKEHLLNSLMPGALEQEQLVDVILEGAPLALGELCRHWLFGHSVAERLPERLHLRLGADSLRTFVPYFLLPYGRSLTIIEPAVLIERMVQASSEAAAHYTDMLKRHSISTKGRLKP